MYGYGWFLVGVCYICSLNTLTSSTTASLSSRNSVQIRTFVEHLRNCKNVPAFSVAISTGEGAVFSEGFGQADIEADLAATAETLFPIGSTTKAFTSMLLAMLIDEKVGK